MSFEAVSVDDAVTLIDVLPNEILVSIFRLLKYDDLIRAEQVCWRWKTMVETCFANEKRLCIQFLTENVSRALNRMKRYGPSIQTLIFGWEVECGSADWAEEIADRFPNLLKIELWNNRITDVGFQCLSTKCHQLESVSLYFCSFANEGLRGFLQALPGINFLTMVFEDDISQFRTQQNLQPQADFSAVFSICRNLHTLELGGDVGDIDTPTFSRFCKECFTLRSLEIRFLRSPAETFAQIQHCSLLEELCFDECPTVDDSTLIQISQGCPKLRKVHLSSLHPRVSDRGLKCFARCQNLESFSTSIERMTDETLVELSRCVNLKKVEVAFSPGEGMEDMTSSVSDRGCIAVLAHCPRLELLDVEGCEEVGDSTVASAIEAVESRHNGLVLTLILGDTSVSPHSFDICHPLLRID